MRVSSFGIAVLLVGSALAAPPQDAAKYTPLIRRPEQIGPAERPGTVDGDFKRALLTQTRAEAQQRWRAFLRDHDPGEYEDGAHARRVRAAKFELARLYYLMGQIAEGDELLRELVLSQ